MIVLGIDPGLSGALAFYSPRADTLVVFDVPVLSAGTKDRKVVDEDALATLIEERADFTSHAFIELVHANPKDGKVGCFSFGTTFGLLRMAVVAHRIPRTYVTPQKWKRTTGAPAAKEGTAARASQLMPRHAGIWTVKKLHCTKVQAAGRSEAALIAYYGAQQLGQR